MENLEQLLIEANERSKSNARRINELAKEHAAIHELALSVKELAVETRSIREEVSAQGEKIEALEKAPGERWNTMTRTVLTTAASTLAGGIVGALLALLI